MSTRGGESVGDVSASRGDKGDIAAQRMLELEEKLKDAEYWKGVWEQHYKEERAGKVKVEDELRDERFENEKKTNVIAILRAEVARLNTAKTMSGVRIRTPETGLGSLLARLKQLNAQIV